MFIYQSTLPPNVNFLFQFPGAAEDAYFEGGPYEWWLEGGKKPVEQGQLVGVVRAVSLEPDTTTYSLRHSYNADGEMTTGIIVTNLNCSLCFSAF